MRPCSAQGWKEVSERVGQWCKGGAAERMHRTLSDPSYHRRAGNRHGCRVNARTGTPMHVMVAWALQQLPGAAPPAPWCGNTHATQLANLLHSMIRTRNLESTKAPHAELTELRPIHTCGIQQHKHCYTDIPLLLQA